MTGSFIELHKLASRRTIPLTVHLELTYRCNALCTHCFQDRFAASRELSTAEWLGVVDGARAAGALILTLSGGEAMVSPHFWPVAERARELGTAIRIFTNGLLLTRANVRRIAALRPLAVEVSIFSLEAKKHDAVTRVPGSLSRAVRGLFRLRRARVPLEVKCPLLVSAGEDHLAVRRLADRLGAGIVFDPQIFPRLDGSPGSTRCRGNDEVLASYFADPTSPGNIRPVPGPGPASPDRVPCGMGRSSVVVSPEGDLLPCPVMHVSAGSVRSTPFDVLWRDSPLFQRLRTRRFGELRECGTCPRSRYCGRCSAMALLEDGDLDGPSSRACHIAELRERAWGVPRPPAPRSPSARGFAWCRVSATVPSSM